MGYWVIACFKRIFNVWIRKFLIETFGKIANGLITLSEKT